jgi:hypothetical protein
MEEVKCDDVTLNLTATANKPPTGNSVSYALRRLRKQRPDLYEQVKAGEQTANEAMVEAGFREKQIQRRRRLPRRVCLLAPAGPLGGGDGLELPRVEAPRDVGVVAAAAADAIGSVSTTARQMILFFRTSGSFGLLVAISQA